MITITVEVSDDVADALTRQARTLLLGRRAYVRALLAAVAAETRPAAGHQSSTLKNPGRSANAAPGA